MAYDSSSALSRPDVYARYRNTTADGQITDADLRIAGLPFHLRGRIDTTTTATGTDIDEVDFKAVDDVDANTTGNSQIDALDFTARNYTGPSGSVPAPDLGGEQWVAFASRRLSADRKRYRAAGRLTAIKSVKFRRYDTNKDAVEATADIGDGVRPLRAVIDVDDRGPGAPDDAKRTKLDTTITPLPKHVHVTFDPSDGDTNPTLIHYDASSTLDVTASGEINNGSGDGCGRIQVTCFRADVFKVPTDMDLTLPGAEGRDYEISNNAGGSSHPDVRATIDSTGDKLSDRSWADVSLLRIPREVRARVDSNELGVLRQAEFHGCDWNYRVSACNDAQGAIGRASFTVRDRPTRGTLPARPDTGPDYVTMVSRDPTLPENGDEHFEAAGSVGEIRHVAFHQRDDDENGEADGTLGVNVDLGAPNTPFDIGVDTAGRSADPDQPHIDIGPASSLLDVHVNELPTRFEACVRQNADEPPDPPDSLSSDALLAPCDRTNVLGRGGDDELETTPLSLHYKATGTMTITEDMRSEAPAPDDRDAANRARLHTTIFDSKTFDIPAELDVDMIPGRDPKPAPDPVTGRKLELQYLAKDVDGEPASIPKIAVRDLQVRRSSDVCADPRPRREASCLKGTITDLPADIFISSNPDESEGDFELRSSAPTGNQPRPAVHDLELSNVTSDSTAPTLISADIEGLTPRLSGRVSRRDLDDTPATLELAEARFNACRNTAGVDRCDGTKPFGNGIEHIGFSVSNSVIGQGVPDPPDPLPGVEDQVSVIQRHDHFEIKGAMSDLREVLSSRYAPGDDDKVIPSTRLRAGFGRDSATAAIRTYVDLADEAGQTVADTVLRQPPKLFTGCLRLPIEPDAEIDDSVWCESQDAAHTAVQLGVRPAASGRKPDVDLKRFYTTDNLGSSVLTGTAHIDNLGDKINVLLGGELRETGGGSTSCSDGEDNDGDTAKDHSDPECRPAQTPDIVVAGEDEDGHVGDVAGRMKLTFQNYEVPEGGDFGPPANAKSFPWKPFRGSVDPENDHRNDEPGDGDDPGGTDFVRAIAAPGGRFLLQASVPHVRTLGITPGPCDVSKEIPAASDFELAQQPVYRCLRAGVAPGLPLGVAFRTAEYPEDVDADADPTVMAIEEGHISQMPAGDEGLEATLTTLPPSSPEQPSTLDDKPLCDAENPVPCRPPLMSVHNDRKQQSSADTTLEARMFMGTGKLLESLRKAEPSDDVSSRLNYEEPPRLWEALAKGARVKLGTQFGASALRMGLNLGLPRYLDLYPPTSWSCKTMQDPPDAVVAYEDCQNPLVSTHNNDGFDSSDLFFKLVGAEDKHGGSGHDYLGRVSLFVKPFDLFGTEIVLTGVRPPDHKDQFGNAAAGASSVTPEDLPRLPDGDASFYGAQLPGHLDIRIQSRNDYRASQDLTPIGIGDNQNQQLFTQVDGRTNRPLSMTLRINGDLKTTRDGDLVPGTSLSAFNLPGTNDVNDYVNPSFRIRSEIRPSFDGGDYLTEAMLPAYGALRAMLDALGLLRVSPIYVSPVFPSRVEPSWLDIKLNADPDSNGTTTTDHAARTVDAVAGPFGALNSADLRGWRSIHDTAADYSRNDGAVITPQANIRLTDFELGADVGYSFLGVAALGIEHTDVLDLILGLTGSRTERTKLAQLLSSLSLHKGEHPNDSGRVLVGASAEANFGMRMVVNLLWGLFKFEFPRIDIGHTQQDVEFIPATPTDRATSCRRWARRSRPRTPTMSRSRSAIPTGPEREALSDAQANTAASALALVTS